MPAVSVSMPAVAGTPAAAIIVVIAVSLEIPGPLHDLDRPGTLIVVAVPMVDPPIVIIPCVMRFPLTMLATIMALVRLLVVVTVWSTRNPGGFVVVMRTRVMIGMPVALAMPVVIMIPFAFVFVGAHMIPSVMSPGVGVVVGLMGGLTPVIGFPPVGAVVLILGVCPILGE